MASAEREIPYIKRYNYKLEKRQTNMGWMKESFQLTLHLVVGFWDQKLNVTWQNLQFPIWPDLLKIRNGNHNRVDGRSD